MADQITLRAERGRPTGSRQSRRIRREGGVPAIVYGRDVDDPVLVTVDHHDLLAALSTAAGTNAIITLDLGDGEVLTMPRMIDRHPFRNLIRHVDFVTVSLTEKVRAEVAIHLEGTPAGVRDGGVLSQPLGHVQVMSFPAEIPPHITLDVSEMGLNDTLRISDLPAMEGVEYLVDPESVVANVSIPRAVIEEVEEEEAAEAALEGEELEGEEAPEAEQGAAGGEPEEASGGE